MGTFVIVTLSLTFVGVMYYAFREIVNIQV